MAAANASPRGQRVAIFASPLHELTGFCLAVDCLNSECRRDRMFAVTELAGSTAVSAPSPRSCAGCVAQTVVVGASLLPGWLPGDTRHSGPAPSCGAAGPGGAAIAGPAPVISRPAASCYLPCCRIAHCWHSRSHPAPIVSRRLRRQHHSKGEQSWPRATSSAVTARPRNRRPTRSSRQGPRPSLDRRPTVPSRAQSRRRNSGRGKPGKSRTDLVDRLER